MLLIKLISEGGGLMRRMKIVLLALTLMSLLTLAGCFAGGGG